MEDAASLTGKPDGAKVLHVATIIGRGVSASQRKVYTIGFPEGKGRAEGTVIAIVDKGLHERYIVAPEGGIYYAPELSAALSIADGKRAHRLVCLYEKSCGAVVFRQEGKELRFLLVKNKNGRHWGFPKGHMEKGESEEQTAIREVREETGLHIDILKGFRETSLYRPFGRIKKQVVFFIAQSKESRVTLQRTEIDHFRWATFFDAIKLFRYDNDIRVLKAAEKWILEQEQGDNEETSPL